jgi:hypothetical protein
MTHSVSMMTNKCPSLVQSSGSQQHSCSWLLPVLCGAGSIYEASTHGNKPVWGWVGPSGPCYFSYSDRLLMVTNVSMVVVTHFSTMVVTLLT